MDGDEPIDSDNGTTPKVEEGADLQFYVLYLTRFAEGFGFISLLTLLPAYINTLDPEGTIFLGLSISTGFIIGMYTTGFTLAQTVVVVPLAWPGDRFDKRTVLLIVLELGSN